MRSYIAQSTSHLEYALVDYFKGVAYHGYWDKSIFIAITYDASGDYAPQPLECSIEEHMANPDYAADRFICFLDEFDDYFKNHPEEFI